MDHYRIIGIESSPYAVKVRAVMRYRHIPHRWIARMPQFFDETAAVRPLIMPVVQFPNGEYRTDSTPILLALEDQGPPTRRILPDDKAFAYLALLIEDMADEWLTKHLFNSRFGHGENAKSGATWVMDDAHPDINTAELASVTDAFIARQTSRMALVGCTPGNAPILERFFTQLLHHLESFVATERFLFGSRPSLADFGLYGQLSTLSVDPTTMRQIRGDAQRTYHWTKRLDDTSGIDGEWLATSEPPAAVAALVALAGTYYLPYLASNARAIDNGDTMVEVEIDGDTYRQPVFRYHRKCLDQLRKGWSALPGDDAERIKALLENTGCLPVLQAH